MRIFRVEHKTTTIGPYITESVFGIMESYFLSPKNHPEPEKFDNGEKFGFDSLENLSNWFDSMPGIYELKKKGFVCREYEIEKIHVRTHPGKQISFKFEHATLIKTYDLAKAVRQGMEDLMNA